MSRTLSQNWINIVDMPRLLELVKTRLADVPDESSPGTQIILLDRGEEVSSTRGKQSTTLLRDVVSKVNAALLASWQVREYGAGADRRVVLTKLWPYQILVMNMATSV